MKKKIIIISSIIMVLILVVLYLLFKKGYIEYFYTSSNDYLLLKDEVPDFESEIESGYVFKNYDDFKNKTNSNKLTEKDFKRNNFVYVSFNYDECGEKNIKIVEYSLVGNELKIKIEYEEICKDIFCITAKERVYLFKINKSINNVNVSFEYNKISDPNCKFDVTEKKPIIYLYPNKKTEVTVKLLNDKFITTSYPKYKKEWKVTANPNGTLVDSNNKKYYGLYWEGKNHITQVKEDGFVVKGEDTIEFLEEKLSILGLNYKESNEFIIYWLKHLENNKYNYIRFETEEEINSYMPLEVNPKPDTVIRVWMTYKPLDKKIDIKEQELKQVTRNGFTLVEWGGSEIN